MVLCSVTLQMVHNFFQKSQVPGSNELPKETEEEVVSAIVAADVATATTWSNTLVNSSNFNSSPDPTHDT